jgi:hypothetical protein
MYRALRMCLTKADCQRRNSNCSFHGRAQPIFFMISSRRLESQDLLDIAADRRQCFLLSLIAKSIVCRA